MTLNCLYSSPQAILKSSQIVTEQVCDNFYKCICIYVLAIMGPIARNMVGANHWSRNIETITFIQHITTYYNI